MPTVVSPLSPYLRIHFISHFFFSEKKLLIIELPFSYSNSLLFSTMPESFHFFLLFSNLLAKPFPQENVTFLFTRHGYFLPSVLNEAEALMMKVSRLLYHTKSSAFRKVCCLKLISLPNQILVLLQDHGSPASSEKSLPVNNILTDW